MISLLFPVVSERIVNSALLIGSIISATTIISILCDFIFPQILKASNWKQQFVIGMLIAILLNTTLYHSLNTSDITLLIIAGLLWSLYYEFCAFAVNNFLAVSEKGNNFSYDWGLISVVYNVTSIIGPILASLIINDFFVFLLGFELMALLGIAFLGLVSPKEEQLEHKSRIKQTIDLMNELKIWEILVPKVLPLFIFSIIIGMIDSFYWTIGALYAEDLFGREDLTFIPIVIYSIPFIFGGLIIARINLKKYKKKISQLMLFIAGLVMSLFFLFYQNILISIILIIISSLFLALAGPLNDAAYSNLLQRLGKNMEHLVGIKKMSYSIAYLLGPVFAGFLGQYFGYGVSFAVMGLIAILVSIILIITTPRKLLLPQQEIAKIAK
jgi:hypothetical protein